MIIVAIDVAKDKHDCFITNTDGEILFEPFVIPNSLDGFDDLFGKLQLHQPFQCNNRFHPFALLSHILDVDSLE